VQKLAHVARPVVPSQELQGRFADLFAGAEAPVEHGHEVLCQQVHVAASGAQGRNLYRDCAQAVKQVFAEKALPHHGGHIAIGCGQNPDIHSNFPGAADMPERGGIEDAQQLGLGRWAYLPDLIEENRSTMGDFEQSRLGAIRSGERATLVAEQFALKQVFL
jgi:hypothetical protein